MKYRDVLDRVLGSLGCVLSPILLLVCAIVCAMIGTFFALTIKYWYLSIAGVVFSLVCFYYYVKITEWYNKKKQQKEWEIERNRTYDFCKNHIELKKPFRHKIVGWNDYSKTELRWHKYGKAIIKQNEAKMFCVEISNILQKTSTSSGFHSINSYEISIFDIDAKYDMNSLVNLKESEIVCVLTEDWKKHVYINPKLYPLEESNAILKYESIYQIDAKVSFPFKVEIHEANEFLNQADTKSLIKQDGKWGLRLAKKDGNVVKFIPLLNNLKIETLPSAKWELTNKQAKIYVYYFSGYEKNDNFVPNNIFADKTQPAFIWKETTKTFLDSEIHFDIKFDLAFTVVEIVSLIDGKTTTIRIIDDCYSTKGMVVKTIEIYSFEGEFAPLYNYYLSECLDLARRVEEAVRSGKFYGIKINGTVQTGKPSKDKSQDEVINLKIGYHLVLAPPGCGKTRVLADRVMHAIDNGVKVEDMLCLTFTNRAAREMKERVEKRVESEAIERLFVGNVHHFCSSLLRENKVIAQKTTIIDDEEKSVIISEIIKNKYGTNPTNVDDYYYFQHILYQRENHHPEELIVKPDMKKYLDDERYLRIAREYLSYKKRYDLIDFEDLLLYGYDYIVNHQNDIKRYSWIQVDEVQDLNRLQLAIIEMVTAHEASCVVYLGDEQQAIYSFMGAKLDTLKYLKGQCQGNIHHFLGNYRSPKYLLDVYNKYAEVNLQVDKVLLPQAQGENADMAKPQDGLLIESCEQREGFTQWDYCTLDMTVDRAMAYPDGRTAILTYSNKDSDKISERLERKGVEHFKIAGTDFLWTKEVKLIFSHLNVFTQPENIMSWARILQGIGICKKMVDAHRFISEANNTSLRGNDLMDNARHQMIKRFIYDCAQEYVIFDTETTGLDVNQDDIVEIAAIRIRNGLIVDELDLMLYTEKTIPAMLRDKENPLPAEYAKHKKIGRKEGLVTFLQWVGNSPVLAHNAKFDYQILNANLQRDCGINDLAQRWTYIHDSLAIIRGVEPNIHSYRLEDLLVTLNLEGKNSHLAIDDVKATKSLVDYCHRKASMVFVLQNDFFGKNKETITQIQEVYGKLYNHTKSLMQQKSVDGERNLLASEIEYTYHYFKDNGLIDELPKMKYLMTFLSEDYIPKDTGLTLQQLLDKYMIELMTLRESDLCESKSMKDKVNIYVSTIHRAKGLEFENIIVFDVRDGFFPFFEWKQILDRTFDPAERERAQKGIQEDARKLYVAISRAKKRLCIQYPRNNTGHGKMGWFDWPAKESPFMACIKHFFVTMDK